MDRKLFDSQLTTLEKHRYLLLLAVIVALLANGILVGYLLQKRQWVILLPPTLEEKVSLNVSSPGESYLQQMSRFLLSLRFDKNPVTAAEQSRLLLSYTDNHFYHQLKDLLMDEDEKIQKQQITLAYYPQKITSSIEPLTVLVEGELHRKIKNEILPVRTVSYRLRYAYHYGKLILLAMEKESGQ